MTNRNPIVNYLRCLSCWRAYDKFQLVNGPYEACKCGMNKFRGAVHTSWLRRFLTDWKYMCFGEKAYEKRS